MNDSVAFLKALLEDASPVFIDTTEAPDYIERLGATLDRDEEELTFDQVLMRWKATDKELFAAGIYAREHAPQDEEKAAYVHKWVESQLKVFVYEDDRVPGGEMVVVKPEDVNDFDKIDRWSLTSFGPRTVNDFDVIDRWSLGSDHGLWF